MNSTKMRECDRCNKYCFSYMFTDKITGSEMKLISRFIKKLNKEQLLYVSNMIFIERRNRK